MGQKGVLGGLLCQIRGRVAAKSFHLAHRGTRVSRWLQGFHHLDWNNGAHTTGNHGCPI